MNVFKNKRTTERIWVLGSKGEKKNVKKKKKKRGRPKGELKEREVEATLIVYTDKMGPF